MSAARRASRSIASKAITPLIDTLFIVMFGLLTVSQARTSQRQDLVHIRLPRVEGKDAAALPAPRTLQIDVDEHSRIRLHGSSDILATRADLDRALGATLRDAIPEEVAVQIRGDSEARHGVTVALLQHLRLRGFSKIALVAQRSHSATAAFGEDR